MENNIFHPIFLSLFSILFVFTPTKNTLKVSYVSLKDKLGSNLSLLSADISNLAIYYL